MCISLLQQKQLLSDRDLMERACAGEQATFEILVERYQETLYRFVSNRVGREQAPEILQFVWLQLYLAMPNLLTQSTAPLEHRPLKAWLFCIARNRCIDEVRRHRRRPQLFSELSSNMDEDEQSLTGSLLDASPSPEEQAEQHDVQRQLRQAIGTLPPRYQAIVWLRYTQELSFSEIGSRLNMPANTVKTYFHRARPQLCAVLSEKLSA